MSNYKFLQKLLCKLQNVKLINSAIKGLIKPAFFGKTLGSTILIFSNEAQTTQILPSWAEMLWPFVTKKIKMSWLGNIVLTTD